MPKRSRSASLLSDPGTAQSPFRQCALECTMSLPPAYIGREQQGIHELLNARLIEYDERLGGVLLAYSHVRLTEGSGLCFAEEPEIQFRVRFKALVFSPRKGMVMEGYVRQLTSGHMMLHAFGVFQVAITKEMIHPRYTYSSSFGHFVASNDPEDLIAEGSKVTFRVLELRGADGPFFIEGALLDDDLGTDHYLGARAASGAFKRRAPSKKAKKAKKEKKEKKAKKEKKQARAPAA